MVCTTFPYHFFMFQTFVCSQEKIKSFITSTRWVIVLNNVIAKVNNIKINIRNGFSTSNNYCNVYVIAVVKY